MEANVDLGKQERDSSIELMRIVAMVAIVVSHVTQSLLPSGGGISALDPSYCIDFRIASADPGSWLLVFLRTLGAWGNTIFVIVSAWFLCLNDRVRLNRVVKLVLDVLVISLVVLALAVLFGVRPGAKDIVKCLFPTTFANNWFVTCYILLYAIHPALNWVFKRMGKRGHAGACVALFGIYMLLPMVHGGHFWINEFLIMVTEYVLVAYGRYYLLETLGTAKVAWVAFLAGTGGMLLSIVLLEQAGLHVSALTDKMLHFDVDGNPLLFLSAFGLFNLVRLRPFVSARVNRIAPIMLLVYLIHENLIVRSYVRPSIWLWIHDVLGYDMLFVWLALFSLVLFAIALFFGLLYNKTLSKYVGALGTWVAQGVRKLGNALLDRICALS